MQNKSAIAICEKNGLNKTNHPSKEAVLTSFEGRILYIIFGTSYFATGSFPIMMSTLIYRAQFGEIYKRISRHAI